MSPFDPQRYLGLDDREFREFQAFAPGRRWWQVLLWLAYAKRRRFVRALLWTALAVAGAMLALNAFLAVLEPWNHSLYLWSTLTGSWYGEFAAPGGRQFVQLQIDGDAESPPIEGAALTCDHRGTVRHFSITGSPHNWRGSRFRITTARQDEFDDEGVRFATIEGAWSGNTMSVTATLEPFKQNGGASIGSTANPPLPEPQVHFDLIRGNNNDFATACGRLRAAQ